MKKVAFVTIGQSPRVDIVPEMLPLIGATIEPLEIGVLDGLERGEIAAMAPRADEHTLVSRLRDGSEVKIGKRAVQRRLQAIMDDLDARDVFLVVLLCTGHFPGLSSRTLMVEAQRVVDHTVEALAEDGRTVGIMVPAPEQIDEFHVKSSGRYAVVMAHASPYSGDRLAVAARELGKTDLVVMHCMGYTEAMRRTVADACGRPVVLARRALAYAVAQLV